MDRSLPPDRNRLHHARNKKDEHEEQPPKRQQEPRDDFDKFCKPGSQYDGTFQYGPGTFDVHVVFDTNVDQDPNKVRGTITIEYERWNRPKNKLVRPFTVALNLTEGANPSVTGEIDNKDMLTQSQFVNDVNTPISEHQREVRRLYNMLSSHTKINIRFAGNGMQFSIHPADGTPGSGVPLDLR